MFQQGGTWGGKANFLLDGTADRRKSTRLDLRLFFIGGLKSLSREAGGRQERAGGKDKQERSREVPNEELPLTTALYSPRRLSSPLLVSVRKYL